MSNQILSELFKDSFYYGVLVQVHQTVDLREIYNFTPAVSEEDFFLIQQLSYRRINPSKPQRTAFYPLRLMVYCSFCNQTMRVGPSTGSKGTRYLNYRCDNKNCTRKKRSIRAKEVFNFIYKFLEEGLNFSEQEYEEYSKNITSITDNARQKARLLLHNKQGVLKRVKSEIKTRSLKIVEYPMDSIIWQANSDKIIELENQVEQLNKEIVDLETKLTNPEDDRLTLEQFLNLSKNAAITVQSADAVVKDIICRQIFLNFSVNEEKVVSYQLKEPFATLLKHRTLISSRGDKN